MSIQNLAEYLFPAGNFAQIRANAPDRATYNIESTRDLVENQPLLMTPFAPVGAAAMSIPYDLVQASMRARDTFFKNNPTSFGIVDDAEVPIGPSMVDFASAVAAENPIDSLVQRTKGATLGLADRLTRAPEFLNNLFFTSAYAPEPTEKEKKSIELEDDLMNYDEFYEMPEEKKREGILSKLNPMNALGFLANVATGGLSNALTTTGLGTLFSKIAEAGRNTPNYQYRTPGYQGRLTASDFYDPKTGLNRFDRAKTLFGQSRTMKEFLDKLKDKRAAAAAKLADARRAIAEDRYGGDPTYDEGQQAGMGFGGGRTDPTDKS
tara:strand:- start:111 stop:1076 length:966 start_codon:yes stop_codon:yes gene_type:complete